MAKYDHKKIEKKWQKKWAASGIYRSKENLRAPKSYVLDMFPYPSGEGLHVGHPKGYIATDVYSRMKRMQGHAVLHPMGWDAFGLPAENFAIKNKVHPRKAVDKNVKRFKEQLGKIGFNYDWTREINTTDPGYYTWTQWIFLQLYKKGLAYQSHEPINWCPSCQTGLSNEDLDGGVCERCGSQVEKRPMRQWVLKITKYADRLLEDLDLLPKWPESIKESQRNWIGKSEGAKITFTTIYGSADTTIYSSTGVPKEIVVFTTRPDTLFGATFIAISPELAQKWVDVGWQASQEIRAYIKEALAERMKAGVEGVKEKTGIVTGISATNPANQEKIPVWITNYVLGTVGTGAIMAVPAHDERDYDFAKKYGIPVRRVVEPKFTRAEGEDAVRDGMEYIRRNAVCVVVRNPKDDKYLAISWKKAKMNGLITGGLEAGENVVEAARREVREETGYKNLKFVRSPDIAIHSLFYHRMKQQNRWARFQYVFFDLENEERDAVDVEEAALHEVVWRPRAELKSFFTVIEGDFLINLIDNPDYIFTGAGALNDSGHFNGMDSEDAKQKITDFVRGKWTTSYRLQDWVFSRQRYWGEPIPIIHCEKCGAVPVPEKDLPVKLPEVKKYAPTGTGESPLAAIETWVNVKCPTCKGKARRETNTMPQWAGSSWYYLRYMDPKNKKALVDKKREKYWAPVDLYVGGAEHATRHLIYARFWHKFLYDIKAVSTREPFERLISVGLIHAEDGRKMSKRFGNVINPDDVVETWGADTLRVYEMFMGPFSDAISWSTQNMIGSRRFLERVWKLAEKVQTEPVKAIDAALHRAVKKVGEDIEAFKLNTAISEMMIFLNAAEKEGAIGRAQWEMFLKILAPFAPHMTEELWSAMKQKESIHVAEWPKYDENKFVVTTITIAVSVNGKVRGQIQVSVDVPEADAIRFAKTEVEKWLEGREVVKTIYVPGRIVNIVVKA